MGKGFICLRLRVIGMTQYVRGATPSVREYWLEMIESETIPVMDGGPKLGLLNRILGKRGNAYYVLDADALEYSARIRMVQFLSNSYNVPESVAEKWIRNYRILAKTVVKVNEGGIKIGEKGAKCLECGGILPEENVKFCPKCGVRLSSETASKVMEEKTKKTKVMEIMGEEAYSQQVQVQRLENNSIAVTDEDLAVRANNFKITWFKVRKFLEFMHENFDLYSITFDENGEAKPVFKTKEQ